MKTEVIGVRVTKEMKNELQEDVKKESERLGVDMPLGVFLLSLWRKWRKSTR